MARFIRFVPTEYYGHKTLRVEVYGVLLSTGTNSIFSVPCTISLTVFSVKVLGKSGRGYYDLPHLFRMLHKISQPILIHQANTLSTPIFSNKMYFFISYHRKYSQSEFRNSIVYMVVLCPLLVLCAPILFLSKSSM